MQLDMFILDNGVPVPCTLDEIGTVTVGYAPPVTVDPTCAAAIARDAGIAQAAEHAGPTWGDNALAFLTNYAQTAVGPFLSEDVVAAAERWQMAAPTDKRAWGSVFQTASKRGLIHRVGYGQARTSHLAAKPLWWRV